MSTDRLPDPPAQATEARSVAATRGPGDAPLAASFVLHSSASMVAALALLLAFVEVLLDWTTSIDLNVAIIYGLPLVWIAARRNRKLLWGLTLFLILMTFCVYFVQIPPGVFSAHEPLFLNRVLDVVALILTAGLLQVWMAAADITDAQSRTLKVQNDRLEFVNRELVRREQEIARQNEELDRRRCEAEEASNRKTRLLASASHDIRTPVSAINLMAEVICQAAENPGLLPQLPDMAHRLQDSAAIAGRLGFRNPRYCQLRFRPDRTP